MPIRPENRNRYPKDWKQIRERILNRAGNRCEGSPAYPDCRAINGMELRQLNRATVVLTIAHINHIPEDCRDENLRAWCQRCHNTYDMPMRRAGIKARAKAKMAAGDLFDERGESSYRPRADRGAGE